jgi:circadian clock protein KaiB
VPTKPTEASFRFSLYVAGVSSRSARAIVNVRAFCEQRFGADYVLDIIDIAERPDAARDAQLIAAPTLVKELPPPAQRFIGDLSEPEVLAQRLGVA